jgi:hypothetical protein
MAANNEPHHSWKPISNSEWEQPYGFQDAFYGRILGKAGEPALFLVASSIKFRYVSPSADGDPAKKIRDAWIQTRYAYPIMATVAHEDRRSYKSPQNAQDIDQWANETFKVELNRTVSDIWRDLIKTRQPTLYFLPKTNELFLQSEHTHLDGRGFLHFWDELFALLVNPRPVVLGQDVGHLLGRADDYLNTQERSPGRGLRLATHLVESLEVTPPETSIAYHLTNVDDVAHQPLPLINSRAVFTFSKEETKKINDECKSRNLSLTAVWHTAIVLATQDVQRDAGVQPGSTYVTFANFDLRRYFKQDSRECVQDKAPIGNYHGVLPYIAKPNGRSFLNLAQDLSSFYRLGLQDQPDVWSALRPMMQAMGDAFTQGPLTDTTPAVSSLGVVDHYIKKKYQGPGGECFISDAWFGDTVTGPWIECFKWLWQGSLVLGSCFNGSFYSSRELDEFHRKVRWHILDGLNLATATKGAKL